MADGLGSSDIFRSRILGMGLEDTPNPAAQVGAMMGGANPEQIQSFFSQPQVQQQFQSFGIDPSQLMQHIRQSPFVPNQFMQGHPLLGGAFTGAMANMAATPEAPLVSGAGSGLSRAAQGMYGGPEMLRQYQLHQMMAPFGMLGSMMPTYGEQRRRAIEEAIVNSEHMRQQMMPEQMDLAHQRADIAQQQAENAANRAYATRPFTGPGGEVYTFQQPGFQGPTPPVPQGQMGPMQPPAPLQQPGWAISAYPNYGGVQQFAESKAAPQKEIHAATDASRERVAETGAGAKRYAADAGAQSRRDVANITAGNRIELKKLDGAFRQAKNETDIQRLMMQINANPQIPDEQKQAAQQLATQALQRLAGGRNQAGPLNPQAKPTGAGGRGARAGGTGSNQPATNVPSQQQLSPTDPAFWGPQQ